MYRMPKFSVIGGLAGLLVPAAALAATPQSQSSSLSVSATVVPSCEVAVSTEDPRIAAHTTSPDRLAVASCTPGEEPKVTVERAPAARPSTGTAAGSDGTVYVTVTY